MFPVPRQLLSSTLNTTSREKITNLGTRLGSKSGNGSHTRDGIAVFFPSHGRLLTVERTLIHSIILRIQLFHTPSIISKELKVFMCEAVIIDTIDGLGGHPSTSTPLTQSHPPTNLTPNLPQYKDIFFTRARTLLLDRLDRCRNYVLLVRSSTTPVNHRTSITVR